MPTYYYYGSPGYAYRRAYNCACVWFWIFLVCLLLIIILPAAIGTSGSYHDYAYGPGDTRIVSGISESFCTGISLSDRSTYTTTLYSLKKKPLLNGMEVFSVPPPSARTQTVQGYDGYVYWSYFMHTGSKFSVSMCLRTSGSSLSLLFIKGKHNFDSWTDGGKERYVKRTSYVSSVCPTSGSPISYTVPAGYGDDWYIVVYNSRSSSKRFDITLSVNRTEYTIVPSDVRHQCTPSGTTPCSIPLTGGDTYLVKIDPGSSPNYEDNVDINVDCVLNGGLVAVIVIIPTLFFISVITAIVVGVCCCVRRKKRSVTSIYSSVPSESETAPTSTSVTVTATAPTQPPTNPEYSAGPPPYSTPTAPPSAYGSTEKPLI
jgi:hypothetical protein